MLKTFSLAMGIGIGALALSFQPATAGVQIGIGGGYYDNGYASDYYDDYDEPVCRIVRHWVKRWNPYQHRWNRVKIVERICD